MTVSSRHSAETPPSILSLSDPRPPRRSGHCPTFALLLPSSISDTTTCLCLSFCLYLPRTEDSPVRSPGAPVTVLDRHLRMNKRICYESHNHYISRNKSLKKSQQSGKAPVKIHQSGNALQGILHVAQSEPRAPPPAPRTLSRHLTEDRSNS